MIEAATDASHRAISVQDNAAAAAAAAASGAAAANELHVA
jgi:hypothetical protein